jgi:hypothetical protein
MNPQTLFLKGVADFLFVLSLPKAHINREIYFPGVL